MSHAVIIILVILILMLTFLVLAPVRDDERIRSKLSAAKKEDFESLDAMAEDDEIELDLEPEPEATFLVLEEEVPEEEIPYTPTISASIPEFSTELSASEEHMDAPVAVIDEPVGPAIPEASEELGSGPAKDVDPYINRDIGNELETMVDISINNIEPASRAVVSAVLEESASAIEEEPPPPGVFAEEDINADFDRKMVIAGKGRARAIYRISPSGNATYMSTRVRTGVDRVKIPATVVIANRELKVDGIAKNAFAGRAEIKAVMIEADRLSRYSIRGCFRNSRISTVLVPEDKRFLYRHVFTRDVTQSSKKLKVKSYSKS